MSDQKLAKEIFEVYDLFGMSYEQTSYILGVLENLIGLEKIKQLHISPCITLQRYIVDAHFLDIYPGEMI